MIRLFHPRAPIGGCAVPEGRLSRLSVGIRSDELRNTPLRDLTAEVLARVRDGSFCSNDEAVLLGSAIQDALRDALDVHSNRWSRRRYRDLFGTFYEFVKPADLDGATIVDLGCGSLNPYGLLFLFLAVGARRGFAIDLDDIDDVGTAIRALTDVASGMLLTPAEYVGEYPIRVEQILANLASFDFAKLHAGDAAGLDSERLRHSRESAHALSLADGEADLVLSTAFFEHIPRVEDAIVELGRVTRKGGLGVHIIDGSDHRHYASTECHPLEFLTENSEAELVHGSNRIRPLAFASLFERHGFEVISTVPVAQVEISTELRSRLVEPFRSMPEEHLAVWSAKIAVRRN